MSDCPLPSEEAAALSLLLERHSRARVRRLLAGGGEDEGHGTAASSPGSRLREWVRSGRQAFQVRRRQEACRQAAVGLLSPLDEGFPVALTCIEDAPQLLYCRGELEALQAPAIAVVGARRASRYGLDLARGLAAELAGRGVPIVSGLALGIDAAAHQGALDAQGSTVAVLGSGLERIQPMANLPLARRILEAGGLLLSEYPLTRPAAPHHFPERNRLISGLCLGVVVVEAGARSGSLITARLAAEQGREVMAMPGAPGLPNSAGGNRLLKTGAALIESADDVLAALGLLEPGATVDALRPGTAAGLTGELAAVLDMMDGRAMSPDELATRLAIGVEACHVRLTELELGGFVQRVADGYIRRPSGF